MASIQRPESKFQPLLLNFLWLGFEANLTTPSQNHLKVPTTASQATQFVFVLKQCLAADDHNQSTKLAPFPDVSRAQLAQWIRFLVFSEAASFEHLRVRVSRWGACRSWWRSRSRSLRSRLVTGWIDLSVNSIPSFKLRKFSRKMDCRFWQAVRTLFLV